jgi:hypothetical protein
MGAQCGASLERLSWWPRVEILRVGPGHRTPYSPWQWACTIRWRWRRAEMLGATRAPTPPERRAIRRKLFEAGAREVIWERIDSGGGVHRVLLPLRPPSEER